MFVYGYTATKLLLDCQLMVLSSTPSAASACYSTVEAARLESAIASPWDAVSQSPASAALRPTDVAARFGKFCQRHMLLLEAQDSSRLPAAFSLRPLDCHGYRWVCHAWREEKTIPQSIPSATLRERSQAL
ncbi:hypothetical protein F4780DRAFT_719799 [Xylariomycetidae sp. FL0641]|nr:hypothetical protein F4780DRAFT_719799 [Xylariomycetidae sp. FL0641]